MKLRLPLLTLMAVAVAIGGCRSDNSSSVASGQAGGQGGMPPAKPEACARPYSESEPPPIEHVFVIVLENKSFDETYGPDSPAVYLRDTLVPQGQLLTHFYGTSHASTGNYISLLGAQAPNPASHGDCAVFAQWTPFNPAQPVLDYGQANGAGCMYPANIPTLVDEMDAYSLIHAGKKGFKGYTWRGWMQDMALEQAGAPRDNQRPEDKTCVGPPINEIDRTNGADELEQYAARHNPFLFYRSVVGDGVSAADLKRCDSNVIDLAVGSPSQGLPGLTEALKSKDTTPNYNLIVPDNCHNAHDTESQCASTSGGPGGLAEADLFLKHWVPQILASPAYKEAGMLVILFDEANFGQGSDEDFDGCCGQELDGGLRHRGADLGLNGITGPGGGRFGTVVLSPFTKAGTQNDTKYNHYSMVRTIENLLGLNDIHFDPYDSTPIGDRLAALNSDDATTRDAAIAAVTVAAGAEDHQRYIGYAGLPASEGMHAFGGDVFNCEPK